MTDEQSPAIPQQPLLKVVNDDATPEQVAAIVAVLSALTQTPTAPGTAHPLEWSAPTRRHRRPLPSGGWSRSRFAL